jgi:cytochrome c-type biogenesis protein CcmE
MKVLRAPNKLRAVSYTFIGAAGGLLLYEATSSPIPLLNGIVGGIVLCVGTCKAIEHLLKPRIILEATVEEIADDEVLDYKKKCKRCGENHEYKQLVYYDNALEIRGLDAIVESSEKINRYTMQLTLKDAHGKKTIECYAMPEYFRNGEGVRVSGSLRRGKLKNYIVAYEVRFNSSKTF